MCSRSLNAVYGARSHSPSKYNWLVMAVTINGLDIEFFLLLRIVFGDPALGFYLFSHLVSFGKLFQEVK